MPTTIHTHEDAIITEIEIAAPAERVFTALTDGSQLMQWFSSLECPAKFWKMDARLGGKYGYATAKGTVVVNGVRDFECHGEILEYDPPRVLAYTWLANWHDDATRRTVVRWELTPKSGGTQVKVTHSGLAQEPTARKDYSGGWPGVVEMLKKFVEK
jgi:uncharacterized protein YndB with AHSA1/START domain